MPAPRDCGSRSRHAAVHRVLEREIDHAVDHETVTAGLADDLRSNAGSHVTAVQVRHVGGRDRHDDPRRRFHEGVGGRHLESDARAHRHLREGDGEPAVGHVVHPVDEAVVDDPRDELADGSVHRVVERRTGGGPEHDQRAAFDERGNRGPLGQRVDDAEHPDDRCRIDVAPSDSL